MKSVCMQGNPRRKIIHSSSEFDSRKLNTCVECQNLFAKEARRRKPGLRASRMNTRLGRAGRGPGSRFWIVEGQTMFLPLTALGKYVTSIFMCIKHTVLKYLQGYVATSC